MSRAAGSPNDDPRAYFDMERWENPEAVIVHFYGHTDEPPVVCFDLRYQVKLGGTATRLYQNLPLGGRSYCSLLGPVPFFVHWRRHPRSR
jgi:hypothetical protein